MDCRVGRRRVARAGEVADEVSDAGIVADHQHRGGPVRRGPHLGQDRFRRGAVERAREGVGQVRGQRRGDAGESVARADAVRHQGQGRLGRRGQAPARFGRLGPPAGRQRAGMVPLFLRCFGLGVPHEDELAHRIPDLRSAADMGAPFPV